jgi:low molecular weight protein-tyrosine phosphatase
MLQARLETLGVHAVVESAGLLESGREIASGTVRALAGHGMDVRRHRSRSLDATTVEAASLILGLERAHVREVVLLAPSAWSRAFTLKELVRRGEAMRQRQPGESLDVWLARAHAGRSHHDLLGIDTTDDVLDPYGLADDAYMDTAAEIEDLVTKLAALAWPETAVDEQRSSDRRLAI